MLPDFELNLRVFSNVGNSGKYLAGRQLRNGAELWEYSSDVESVDANFGKGAANHPTNFHDHI